ncbi:hypothetical protein D9758_014185 [Tetrapyrgos nigripes]|uniref:Uncharacterized protein n=1 Tax=Tetrapyrgos nigripes TaxID=182062 RepID=A0A8H5FNJ6_9AGAR|nr:hypothetical protein D9758_014185 [Tetrapyrgos nigripes]
MPRMQPLLATVMPRTIFPLASAYTIWISANLCAWNSVLELELPPATTNTRKRFSLDYPPTPYTSPGYDVLVSVYHDVEKPENIDWDIAILPGN